jgi:transposase
MVQHNMGGAKSGVSDVKAGVNPSVDGRSEPTPAVGRCCIGADTTEELDYVPASFVIREYVRPKYACASFQQGVVLVQELTS